MVPMYTDHPEWVFILLLILFYPSDGTASVCQTQSGQVCRQNETDPTVYNCDKEEPRKKNEVLTFYEGETIELLAVGEKLKGCSFEVKDPEDRVVKCHRYGRYICVKILEGLGKK